MCENLPMKINKEVKGLMEVPQEGGKRSMKDKDSSRGRDIYCIPSSPSWVGRVWGPSSGGPVVPLCQNSWDAVADGWGVHREKSELTPSIRRSKKPGKWLHVSTAYMQISCLHKGTYLICLTFLTYFKNRKIICLSFAALTFGTMSVEWWSESQEKK